MKAIARLAGVAVLALALAALFATAAAASSGHHKPHHPAHPPHPLPAAVFVQTNDPAGNAVVAYERGSDGGLGEAETYPTGGLGGALDEAVVDRLASQGSLTLDREAGLLYAVNAGSDTVTVFAVRGNKLLRRQVVRSGGDFPVSVAVNGRLVYVLNARGGGSLQGYIRFGTKLYPIRFWHRDLGLDSEAAPEFVNTPGQVAFTPDGSKLLVTTKANGHAVDVFDVRRSGGLSRDPVVNELPETVPFAMSFDPQGRLVLAEAAGSVATFDVNGDGTLGAVDLKETGGAATCWIVGIGSTFYASNTGSDTLSGYDVDGGGLLSALGDTSTGPAPIDAAASADGSFLYVQTGAEGGVDEFRVNGDGSLTQIGSILVPGSAGGEGIAAS
ncbi:MAG TPA: beta-propeller fold lactonase family protein [Solirubrobacterales bacterium]|nr:beta-propeller fold lactonase family protein [Solirubrobacterales bacterium]